MILGKTLESWCASYPLIRDLVALQETTWFNPGVAPVAQAIGDVGLTEADVAAIRRDRRVQREIAQQYGVSQSLIQQLQSNKGWNHVC